MQRIPADAWIALVLLAACGLVMDDLLATEGSGAFVKTTTLPIALVMALGVLATILLVSAFVRPVPKRQIEGSSRHAEQLCGLGRAAFVVAWTAVYIAGLPWLGYPTSTAVFLVGASLAFGNRNPISIAAVAIVVPIGLFLFFQKFMIVLLPASRLFG